MKKSTIQSVFFIFLTALVVSCSSKNEVKENSSIYDATLAKPSIEWVKVRVSASKERLQKTEAGRLVWNAIEYHGGLSKWWNNGPLFFRFNYRPKPGTGTIRDTYETADYWNSKTRHQRAIDTGQEYGWSGSSAWLYPDTLQMPYNVRFWSLTPYYFAGIPFVFADEGINLSLEEDTEYDGKTYHIVRVTFGEGVGDAPDDYYVLYITPGTHRIAAIRYIVSFPGYFKNGGHTQEKLMTYEGEQTVNGIIFPEKHRTFMWEEDGSIGAYVTDITLSDVSFKPETKNEYFEIPLGSKVLSGLEE